MKAHALLLSIAALILLPASASAQRFGATGGGSISGGASFSAGRTAPANSVDRLGRGVQSVGSRISNVGVRMQTSINRFNNRLEVGRDRMASRVQSFSARTVAGARNRVETVRTSINRAGIAVRARVDTTRANVGTRVANFGQRLGGRGVSVQPQRVQRVYQARTQTVFRPNGARYTIDRTYRSTPNGRIQNATTVRQITHGMGGRASTGLRSVTATLHGRNGAPSTNLRYVGRR